MIDKASSASNVTPGAAQTTTFSVPSRRAVQNENAAGFDAPIAADNPAPPLTQTVFAAEMAIIKERRTSNNVPMSAEWEKDAKIEPTTKLDLVGVCLSGGGVRSASFSLGALQALYIFEKGGKRARPAEGSDLHSIDYLSTVSGGGYVGAALSLGMTRSSGVFPFGLASNDAGETATTRHIRDNSRYLISNGMTSVLSFLTIYARGLLANFIIIVPILLVVAALLLFAVPTVQSLQKPWWGGWPLSVLGLTVGSSLKIVALLLLLGMVISVTFIRGKTHSFRQKYAGWTLLGLAVVMAFWLFYEIHVAVLVVYYENAGIIAKSTSAAAPRGSWFNAIVDTISRNAPILVTLLAALLPFVHRLGETISKSVATGFGDKLAKIGARALLFVGALILPVLLWIMMMNFVVWMQMLSDPFRTALNQDYLPPAPLFGILDHLLKVFLHPSIVLIVLLCPFALLWWTINVNANSLHQVYRDRLSNAFLRSNASFMKIDGGRYKVDRAQVDKDDAFALHELTRAPYHLVNTALNVPGSRFANGRGRNAEFFVFTPKHLGSELTGYVDSQKAYASGEGFDLGTAMAVSGAAVSPNMGIASIAPLALTLALMNVRLGRWIRHPAQMRFSVPTRSLAAIWSNRVPGPTYLLREMFRRIGKDIDAEVQKDRFLYLTDGGHIDNLGLYELLRRRCALIIVVDGEHDPELRCAALAQVERFARIDLGTLFEIDTAQLADSHKKAAADIAKNLVPNGATHGPHVAVGKIIYPALDQGGAPEIGLLIYVKPSLSGDENSYLRAYTQKCPVFPQESTADQLFSEEQFEAYRALGEHTLRRALTGADGVVIPSKWNPATQKAMFGLAARLLPGSKLRSI